MYLYQVGTQSSVPISQVSFLFIHSFHIKTVQYKCHIQSRYILSGKKKFQCSCAVNCARFNFTNDHRQNLTYKCLILETIVREFCRFLEIFYCMRGMSYTLHLTTTIYFSTLPSTQHVPIDNFLLVNFNFESYTVASQL